MNLQPEKSVIAGLSVAIPYFLTFYTSHVSDLWFIASFPALFVYACVSRGFNTTNYSHILRFI